jgi:hypothetical protein
MANDEGLETLLALDGERFEMSGGFWTKFEVKLVKPTAEIPHGIRYSLTLHDKSGARLLGFDNAHAMKKSKPYAARRVEWDHRHDKERVSAYEFESPDALMREFWSAVDKVLGKN